ncbi:MAG: translation initiation factor IF-2 [Eubacteriales bacterium]|nr:translation initiation factor IF-2 [Eubacteriales bacterium]
MTKMRVYELARELKLDSKEILKVSTDLGFEVKNHMSNLDSGQVQAVRKALAKPAEKSRPAKPKSSQTAQAKQAPSPLPAEVRQEKRPEPKAKIPVMISPAGHSMAELEQLFNLPATQLIKALMSLGVMASINQQLDTDTVEILAAQVGIETEVEKTSEELKQQRFAAMKTSSAEDAVERSPVVTVMGHVDHGKTSLLDFIRSANVTAGEAGGITQHIGAYQVVHNGKTIVFLDTPGHEAFTAMRARGTKITDIAILVVAADEGVMPQTIEAMNHAKAADVPIIVAINKMDKPGANPEKVKQQLSNHGLMPEEWGGDTIFSEVSATSGAGIDNLLEMILLSAEMMELKASPNRLAEGTVIEAKIDKGRGPVATILIQQGTLNVGDSIVCGSAFGKVRAMFNDRGQRLHSSGPSVPVEILGLSDVPPAGEIFQAVADDKTARTEALDYSQEQRETSMARTRVSLEDIFKQMEESQVKELNLLLKSDVQGTTEALKQSLNKIKVQDIKVNIIHDGVGGINQSDVSLASASGAIIIGFNVRPDTQAQRLAEEEDVEIRLYRVIYDVIDDVRLALKGLLEPEFKEKVMGRVEVRNTFRHSKLGTIAGCYVIDGKVTNRALGRLLRDGVIIYEGKLSSLKRFKDDVKEVSSGYECGIMLENYNDIKEGDQIEAYAMVEEK